MQTRSSGGFLDSSSEDLPLATAKSDRTDLRRNRKLERRVCATVHRVQVERVLTGSEGSPPDWICPGQLAEDFIERRDTMKLNTVMVRYIVGKLEEDVQALRNAEVKFRNEIVAGPGGRQILLEDPSGNPVELFEPAPDSTN